jgi:hypothetical protein
MKARLIVVFLIGAAGVSGGTVGGTTGPESAGATTMAADKAAGREGARWLARRPTTRMAPGLQADVIVALARAGAAPRSLRVRMNYLVRRAPEVATTAAGAAKVVLAADAAGLDPTRLRGVDYVKRNNSHSRRGRYGRSSFDQALAMLALKAAGRPVPDAARSFLSSRRGSGGWNFALTPGGKDEVDTTALVVVALRAAGAPRGANQIRGAMAWLGRQKNPRGGYAVAGGGARTGANATAFVIQSEIAVGRRPNRRAVTALRGLQERSGAIRFTAAHAGDRAIATAGAVPALMGQSS